MQRDATRPILLTINTRKEIFLLLKLLCRKYKYIILFPLFNEYNPLERRYVKYFQVPII